MARVTLVFEDVDEGKNVNIDINSDPPFTQDSENVSLAQAMASEAIQYVVDLVNKVNNHDA